MGFKERQLVATMAWQASVTMGVGVIFGAPLGIALGRWLWTLFARPIYVVPQPSVPWGATLLVALGALVFANLSAAIPGDDRGANSNRAGASLGVRSTNDGPE